MNEKNAKKLFDRFKFFHPERGVEASLMWFGFECEDGWFDLIWRLCEDLTKMELPEGFEVTQVKEKFGTLRFYINSGTDDIDNRIDEAEDESGRTCEWCGEPGERRGGGWIRTLCDKCHAKDLLKK